MSRIGVPFAWVPRAAVRAAHWTELSRSSRLVYHRLADHSAYDERTGIWAVQTAITVIAKEEAMSRDTVRKAFVELEVNGFIARLNEPKNGRMPRFKIVTGRIRKVEMTSYSVISDDHSEDAQGVEMTTLTSHIEEVHSRTISDAARAAEPLETTQVRDVHEMVGTAVPTGLGRHVAHATAPSNGGASAPRSSGLVEVGPPSSEDVITTVSRCAGCGSRLYFPGDACNCVEF